MSERNVFSLFEGLGSPPAFERGHYESYIAVWYASPTKPVVAASRHRRMERIGLPVRFGAANPFRWMSDAIDLKKEKNLFETTVT